MAEIGCFGLTEPDTGSDAGNLTSRATRDGDDWVLNGQKLFITNGTWADVALIFARTSDDGPRGVTAFLVPTDTPGFEAREIKGKLGLRGQATAELFLSDVRVPDSAVLGEVGHGFKIAMSTLDKGRLAVAAGCVGIVQGCLETSVDYALNRTQFGRPIAGFQLVQDMLADISVDADADDCWYGAAPTSSTGVSRSARRHPRPSCSPPRPPCARPTTRSRSTAVRATSTNTRRRSISATPG